MLKVMEEGYGKNKSIPQMILASATVDDIFVIVLFTSFTELAKNGTIQIEQFLLIPISIILGLIVGIIVGKVVQLIFLKIEMSNTYKVLVLLSISFLLVTIETYFNIFSGLLAIMAMGATIHFKQIQVHYHQNFLNYGLVQKYFYLYW